MLAVVVGNPPLRLFTKCTLRRAPAQTRKPASFASSTALRTCPARSSVKETWRRVLNQSLHVDGNRKGSSLRRTVSYRRCLYIQPGDRE